MEISELIARQSIHDLVARYNCNGDSGRIDAMMSLFTADAVLEVVGNAPHVGRQAIHQFFSAVVKPEHIAFKLESLQHHITTHQIDILDEQNARGRCYFSVLTQVGLDHWGRYIDIYQCNDQLWQLSQRKVIVDGMTPGGWGDSRRQRE